MKVYEKNGLESIIFSRFRRTRISPISRRCFFAKRPRAHAATRGDRISELRQTALSLAPARDVCSLKTEGMAEQEAAMHPSTAAAAAATNDNADDPLPPNPQSLALALPGKHPRDDSSSSDDDFSSDDDEDANKEQFAGPLDAESCTLGGAGARGGEAGSLQRLYVFSRDARGVKIREGGAYVQAWLQPPTRLSSTVNGAAEPEKIDASVLDAGDGSYAVEFVAPRKGNFDLHVLINGAAVGGGRVPAVLLCG